MSLESPIEEKRKIELPKALREIVKILAEEGPKTYEELADKLEKDETTIIRQVQKLIDMEILVKVEKEGKTAVALAEGVEVDEEGNAYVPSPFEDPVEKLKTLLEEAGVKGRKLKWIMRLVETNPATLQNPQALYDTLTGAGIRRHLAEQIVKAYFGVNFVSPQPPMQMPYQRYPYQQYYGYGYSPYGPMPPPSYDRELLKLEMRIEKLLEELREKKEEKPTYPVIRRIKTDEQGRPIEIIEEPAIPGYGHRDDTSTQLLIKMIEQRQQDRELILKIQEENRKTIEKLTETMKGMLEKMQDMMQQQEQKYREELMKMREELIKKDAKWTEKYYKEKLDELKETIQGIKSYYEEQTKKIVEELKKEWEWRRKLEELEAKRGIRDVVVEEIRAMAKEGREAFKQLREMAREYMERSIKKELRKEVPEVTEEEKKRILEVLRKRAGKKPKEEEKPKEEKRKESKPEVKMKIVGGEGK